MTRAAPPIRTAVTSLLLALLAAPWLAPGPAAQRENDEPAPGIQAPPHRPVTFKAARLPHGPPEGKGRLSIVFEGNRRWCTLPDDRPVRPPQERPWDDRRKGEVLTFGYQFTIAAIRQDDPGSPIMLFESPIIKTASWRTAAKLGQAPRPSGVGPGVGGGPVVRGKAGRVRPDTLVPYWEERYRCVTLGERFDFDLDPGVYDVYMAFDLLNRQGTWVHRMADYLTGVEIEAQARTRLEGRVHQSGANQREVRLLEATLVDDRAPGTAGAP
ncbi:MAG: hypothetical protein ACE5JH_11785 [Acidobacteriota bacterium]